VAGGEPDAVVEAMGAEVAELEATGIVQHGVGREH